MFNDLPTSITTALQYAVVPSKYSVTLGDKARDCAAFAVVESAKVRSTTVINATVHFFTQKHPPSFASNIKTNEGDVFGAGA